MEERALDVFFYGLFMDRELLVAEGYNPGSPQRALLRDYVLRIGERATLAPAQGKSVWGVAMSLPASELQRLYSAASVAAYRPEAVLLEMADGTLSPALCYNLMRPEEGTGNRHYAEELAALAAKLDLPPDYVSLIKQSA